MVTVPVLTIPAAERIASLSNRRLVVTFTTATAVPNQGTITIALPLGFVASVTTGATPNSGLGTATQALVTTATNNNIVITATAEIAAGAKTVTICGVTLGTDTR